MTRTPRNFILTLGVALVAFLAVSVGSAAAHGGKGGLGVGTSALVNAAAKNLNVTSAKVKSAIVDSAVARINAAAKDGDLDEDDAADLKDEATDNLRVAYAISQTSTVASNLSISTTKLNDAFRAARKTLILAKIDAAVKEGDLSADDAADLKKKVESATLPGYKAGGFGFGYGFGYRGHHR
jgi:hypothetical protein